MIQIKKETKKNDWMFRIQSSTFRGYIPRCVDNLNLPVRERMPHREFPFHSEKLQGFRERRTNSAVHAPSSRSSGLRRISFPVSLRKMAMSSRAVLWASGRMRIERVFKWCCGYWEIQAFQTSGFLTLQTRASVLPLSSYAHDEQFIFHYRHITRRSVTESEMSPESQ